jgi:hypothetical protein|tara:strand:+ start:1035 stop:1310 length:276 start_codon:yes stop_codon:yes gene_type:complete
MTDIDEIMGFFGIRGANVIDMRTTRINPIELSEVLWGKYPKHEKRANRDFLIGVFQKLNIGGIWIWPETGRMFRKVNDVEFEEISENTEEE